MGIDYKKKYLKYKLKYLNAKKLLSGGSNILKLKELKEIAEVADTTVQTLAFKKDACEEINQKLINANKEAASARDEVRKYILMLVEESMDWNDALLNKAKEKAAKRGQWKVGELEKKMQNMKSDIEQADHLLHLAEQKQIGEEFDALINEMRVLNNELKINLIEIDYTEEDFRKWMKQVHAPPTE